MVQVNCKVRSRFSVASDATDEELQAKALSDEQARKFFEGQPIKKVVVVKKKLVNIVV